MKTGELFVAGALVFALSAGMAQARIPVAPMDDVAKAKAEEKKAKDADAAKKAGEQLAKAQDRAVENYKKGKGGKAMPEAKGAKSATKK
jgi:hypothetical protein